MGADIDAATVAHAAAKYAPARFVEASLERLPFEDGSFDLVVSFETIEHVADSDAALAELRRVLAPDGTLLISTPNAARYLVDNEFHTREFTAAEFATLLATRFDDVELLQQQNWLASMVLGPAQARVADGGTRLELDLYKLAGIEPGGELYTVAICGPRPPVPPRDVAVAGDVHEAHELAQRVLGADRTAREWRARAGTAERNLAEWERRATEAERQQSAWEERAAEAERVQQAWQERATEAERQADELRARLMREKDYPVIPVFLPGPRPELPTFINRQSISFEHLSDDELRHILGCFFPDRCPANWRRQGAAE